MASRLRIKTFELADNPDYFIVSGAGGSANWEDFDTYLAARTVSLYTLDDDGGSHAFNIGDTRDLTIAGETNELSLTSAKVGTTITETLTLDPRYFIAEQLFDVATNTTTTTWTIPIPPEWNAKKIISFTASNVIGAGEDVTWRVQTDQGGSKTLVDTLVLTEGTPCDSDTGLNTTLATCETIIVEITSVTGTPTGGAFVLVIQ